MNNPVAIQFYLSKKDKEAFTRACFLSDTTMSRELRKFIYSYCQNPPIPDRGYYDVLLRPYAQNTP